MRYNDIVLKHIENSINALKSEKEEYRRAIMEGLRRIQKIDTEITRLHREGNKIIDGQQKNRSTD